MLMDKWSYRSYNRDLIMILYNVTKPIFILFLHYRILLKLRTFLLGRYVLLLTLLLNDK